MSVPCIGDIGQYLLGPERPSDWVQAVQVSLSPLGSLLTLGHGDRLVICQAKYSGGVKQFTPVYQGSVSVTESDEITCLLNLPLISSSNKRQGASSWSHVVVAGFTSGFVRIYSESGKLVVQKAFQTSPVKSLSIQSMPEGKHHTNILHLQSLQELVVTYAGMLASVTGQELWCLVKENLSRLALDTGLGLESSQLASLPASKLIVSDQSVQDSASFISCLTSYDLYSGLSMRGGSVDDRHKPVHTLPVYITCGAGPYLQFNDRSRQHYSPGHIASNVVNTVKSGLARWWGGSGAQEETEAGPVDPEIQLTVQHSVKDESRTGVQMLVSPNKVFTVVRDDKNRVMVVDNISGSVVQAWRGYHRCEMAWSVTSVPGGELTSDTQLSLLLLLYLPRRGLIEVWSPDNKSKVTEFHVSKHGTLLCSAPVSLDDGLPRKRDSVNVFCVFLQPEGVINHFSIPFHALTTSSTAERDFQLQASLQDLMADGVTEENVSECLALLMEIRNAQLRLQTLNDLVTTEKFEPETIEKMFKEILATFNNDDRNISVENKIWRSKVSKIHMALELYKELMNKKIQEDVIESSGSLNETLCLELMTDIEDIEELLQIVKINNDGEEKAESFIKVQFAECLGCFEIDADVNNDKKIPLRLKKNICPSLSRSVYGALSAVISVDKELALDLFQNCCLNIEDITRLTLEGSTGSNQEEFSVTQVRRLFRTLGFLLSYNTNVDDRHRSMMQDLLRKTLRRQPMGPVVFLVATVWKNVLLASACPSVLIFAEDWTRKLSHIRNFLRVKAIYTELLGETRFGSEEGTVSYSLSGVFECGDGRISELLSRWLLRLGLTSRTFVQQMEAVAGDTEEVSGARRLVEAARGCWPHSSEVSVLIIHLCWDQLQAWSRDRDSLDKLQDVVWSMWSLSSPRLRLKYISLIWKTYLQETLRDCARLTESLAKSVGVDKAAKARDTLQMRPDTVTEWLGSLCSILDCQLQTMSLSLEEEDSEDMLSYDNLSYDQSQHLLDQILCYKVSDGDTVSLYHQLSLLLEISWTLRILCRPLSLFTTQETQTVLAQQPGMMSSIFTDHNSRVNKSRREWILLASEAVVGRIHKLTDGEYDRASYQTIQAKLLTLARDWFLTDFVKLCQVECLYKAGYDDIAGDMRTGVTDVQTISDKLLDVSLMRLAKYVWGQAGDSQGRLAALPPSLVAHLAERKQESCSVADSSLIDTVSLLSWVCSVVDNSDRHSVATQALSAVQVLQVRSNRQSSEN